MARSTNTENEEVEGGASHSHPSGSVSPEKSHDHQLIGKHLNSQPLSSGNPNQSQDSELCPLIFKGPQMIISKSCQFAMCPRAEFDHTTASRAPGSVSYKCRSPSISLTLKIMKPSILHHWKYGVTYHNMLEVVFYLFKEVEVLELFNILISGSYTGTYICKNWLCCTL